MAIEMHNQRILKFSYTRSDGKVAGRELLASINSRIIDDIFGDGVIEITVRSAVNNNFVRKLSQLYGWLDGLDVALAHECVKIIRQNNCRLVYIEGSNYGRLAKFIKNNCPSCRVVSFFHNVESRFFWGALRQKPSIKKVGVLFANFFAERLAVKYSDEIICLTERDRKMLGRIYGKEGDHVVPISVSKSGNVLKSQLSILPKKSQSFGIFVGGAFYANIEAVRWLAKNDIATSECPIYVLGRGFENYIEEFADYLNLVIVGEVESLDAWYVQAFFSIAPIFDGSGMKTKVAESLMYGRPIIATSEAFVGYEDVKDSAGFVCDNPACFKRAINRLIDGSVIFDEQELKSLYNAKFSYDASRERMERILTY